MIKHFSLLIVALLLSPLVQASINTNPQFEFGTIPGDRCVVSGPVVSCNIEFENNYDLPPLVFVMATVDASRSDFSSYTTEYPSDLRVMSVTNSSANIKQLLPPTTKACVRMKPNGKCGNANNGNHKVVTYVDAPMSDIDYLVIEPGVLLFDNGAKIVAGEVSFDGTYSNAGGGQNTNKLVGFNSFGLSQGFDSSPGVLVQIQSIENQVSGQPLWLTPIALNPSRTGFSLALDRSEVTRNDNISRINPERVGFVAGLGQGFVNGRKFWLGQGSTKQTTSLNDNVIKPITEGCKLISPFSVSGFTSTPTLLASKRTRNGNNGGWLRRCSVSKTGVSLINEEDMTKDAERGHVVEPFSYFLFDKPPLSEVCELFPSPAQTWEANNSAFLRLSNQSNISGAPTSEGKRFVGFKQENIVDENSPGCDGLMCSGDSGLMVEKQELESFKISSEYINLWKEDRTFSNNEILGKLQVGKGTATFTSGTYWVGEIIIDNGGKIEIPEGNDVTIHARKVSVSNNDSSFGTVGEAEFVLLVHNDPSITNGVVLSQSAKFTGLIYSESDVRLSNSSIVYGAVTAGKIYMANTAQIIATDNHCFQPSDDYNVTMTPESDLSLMCGTDSPIFTVTTTNNGVVEGLPVTVNVLPTSSEGDFSIAVKDSVGTGTYPYFNTSSAPSKLGKLQLEVTVDYATNIDLAETYRLEVTMDSDSSKSDSSTIKYVPFKFAIDDQSVVAGKEYNVTAKVLACNESGTTLVTSYAGTPAVTYTRNQPTSGVDGELDYLPTFASGDKGITQDTFAISESGLFTVNLTDSRFDCSGLNGCPIDGNGQLTGSFDVESRPWKLAICDVTNIDGTTANPAETDDVRGGFIPAGRSFKAHFKPIVHPEFYNTLPADECSYQTTYNYFTEVNHPAPLKVTFELAYPSDGKLSNLESSSFPGDYSFTSGDKTGSIRQKTINFYWQEVGALNLKSDADYFGKQLQQDTQIVGRFYPDYFKITGTTWTEPDNQTGFTYMSQNFKNVNFKITAYNIENQPTDNYQYFDPTLKREFDLAGAYSDRVSISTSDLSGDYWNSGAIWDASFANAQWRRLGQEQSSTIPDGPFNSSDSFGTESELKLAIVSDAGGDPAAFKMMSNELGAQEQQLLAQPHVRYGRMALADVGTSTNQVVKIPLRVEYWQGTNGFVLSSGDNASRFDVDEQCSEVIWSDVSTSSAELFKLDPNETDTVFNGEATAVFARQGSDTSVNYSREQVRLFLRQGTGSPADVSCSWNDGTQDYLQFDWRRLGDEDPSTVVTFGIYRGNDRVIYRGESGLTGQ